MRGLGGTQPLYLATRAAARLAFWTAWCMLAYYLEWHMRRDLAPLLFAEEEPETR
jgi:hypothetical protein